MTGGPPPTRLPVSEKWLCSCARIPGQEGPARGTSALTFLPRSLEHPEDGPAPHPVTPSPIPGIPASVPEVLIKPTKQSGQERQGQGRGQESLFSFPLTTELILFISQTLNEKIHLAASLTSQIETGEILNPNTTQAISCHIDPTSFSFWKTPLHAHETMTVEKANKFLLF